MNLFSRIATAIPIALVLGGFGAGAQAIISNVGAGYVDNLEDITCLDAGTLIESPSGQKALDCSCSGDAYWGDEDVIPLTGYAKSTFNATVKRVKCRSQSGVTCDCHALTTSPIAGFGD